MNGNGVTPAELTAQLRGALKARYDPSEWLLFEEVGFNEARGLYGGRMRVADAIAVHLWRSRGNEVHGFELKATRADWQRELNTVGKADAAGRHCHRWWVVAPPKIVALDELPATWGLLELNRVGKLTVRKQATRVTDPEPLSVSRLITWVGYKLGRTPADEELKREYERGREAGVEQERARMRHSGESEEQLRALVETFEQAAGVRLTEWDVERVGKAVRFVQRDGLKRYRKELEDAARAHLEALAMLSDVVPLLSDSGRSYYHRPTIELRAALERAGLLKDAGG